MAEKMHDDDDAADNQLGQSRIRVPVPDPTLLTTQQLIREQLGLQALLEEKLASVARSNDQHREIIETRLDGMDKAIKLLQDTADKFPARIDEKISALRQVVEQQLHTHVEKFYGIEKQFQERDVRTEQAAGAVKIAVDAALQAQKEAVGEQNKSSALAIAKSENATTKQIDALGQLLGTMTKAFDDKLSDIKDRVNRIEGLGAGAKESWGVMIAIVMALIGIGGAVIAFVKATP
jgi:hypothetical protein